MLNRLYKYKKIFYRTVDLFRKGELVRPSEPPGLRIDLGCGSYKKEETLGIDIQPGPGVDYIMDIEAEPLPFPDRSVAYVHSSHFLEHTRNPTRIFAEIGRVGCDGARLELWTPYGGSSSIFIFDHKQFFVEDHYLHMCVLYTDFWEKILNGRWLLNEFQYVVRPEVLCDLRRNRVSLDFALRYLRNIAVEFCAHITVLRDNRAAGSPPLKRTFSVARYEPRYEVRPTESGGINPLRLFDAMRAFSRGKALPPR